MEQYVEFVGASMMRVDPEKARLQKKLEENIQVMFSFQVSPLGRVSVNHETSSTH